MKAVLDACVLYPTILREILIRLAKENLFIPIWSDRILEEWARAATRLGSEQGAIARGEIALLGADWARANVRTATETEAELYLPDANDVHVLASAITSGSSLIVTANIKDFPPKYLAEFGIKAIHPDEFLCQLFGARAETVVHQVTLVKSEAERLSGRDWQIRKLLKKARLPRFGKAIEGYASSE